MKLEGKKALVTGASSGIGNQIAQAFLEQGAQVGLHYRQNRAGAEALMSQFSEDRCQIFQADFSVSQEVRRLWQEFLMWSGTIHILVNNAGTVAQPQPLDQLSEEAWDSTFQVNVKAPLILSQAVLPTMQENAWGRIINISSIGVKFGVGS